MQLWQFIKYKYPYTLLRIHLTTNVVATTIMTQLIMAFAVHNVFVSCSVLLLCFSHRASHHTTDQHTVTLLSWPGFSLPTST